MWEYINKYASYNTLYHSGAKKEKNSPTKELFRLLFSFLVALLILDNLQTLLSEVIRLTEYSRL